MARKHGPWTIHDSKQVYEGKFITVHEDAVTRPDGEPGTYSTVRMTPGVAVLAVDTEQRVYLLRQFRYAVGRDSLEAITGGIEEGEEPLAAAQREAREELGLLAERWEPLGHYDVDTSIVNCPIHLFLAQGLRRTEIEREGTEVQTEIVMPFNEALELVQRSEITHAPTSMLLLKAQTHLKAGAEAH